MDPMSGDALLVAMCAGWIALLVFLAWPATTHRCRYPRCPHKGEKE